LGAKPTATDDVIISKAVVATGANPLVANSITIANGGGLTVGAADMMDKHPSEAMGLLLEWKPSIILMYQRMRLMLWW